MTNHAPARLLLRLEPLDARLQLGDLAVFRLHGEARDVPAFGDACGAEFVFVEEVDEGGFDGGGQVRGFEDCECAGGEVW